MSDNKENWYNIEADARMVAAALADPNRFDDILNTYAGMIQSLCSEGLGDKTTARDVADTAITLLWDTLHKFDCSKPLGPWIKTLTKRCIASEYRKRKKEEVRHDVYHMGEIIIRELAARSDPRYTPEEVAALTHCLSKLQDRDRDVFLMRYVEELSGAEIFSRMGIRPTHISNIIRKVRNQLLKCIKITIRRQHEGW